MQEQITSILEHMAKSQHEMARTLEAKREVVVHMAKMVSEIPDHNPTFGEIEALMEHSLSITKGISSYLNSLAELEDAIADTLSPIVKAMKEQPGDE
ncbi:hypothetical protein [Paenibacillus planticolens]|uniref:Nucleoside-diphosphate sugar epimerase n=1 Tax=Paenibacillus planticolens TaxID=2654976 RepID=A0ABX1ZWK6_9BACL|nr:hypothetical protein [Paenibacillus planticolens]NOV04253.1 hypothetical protein [Paenibacillus planticolens]